MDDEYDLYMLLSCINEAMMPPTHRPTLVMSPMTRDGLLLTVDWPYFSGVPTPDLRFFGCEVVIDPALPDDTVIVREDIRLVLSKSQARGA